MLELSMDLEPQGLKNSLPNGKEDISGKDHTVHQGILHPLFLLRNMWKIRSPLCSSMVRKLLSNLELIKGAALTGHLTCHFASAKPYFPRYFAIIVFIKSFPVCCEADRVNPFSFWLG